MDTYHLGKRVNENLGKDNLDKKQKEATKDEFNHLISCSEPGEFQQLLDKTLDIWEEKCPHFKNYFENQWIESDFSVWSRSKLEPGIPNSSSSVEGLNAVMKRYTERRAKTMPQFLNLLSEILVDLSGKSHCHNAFP